MSALPLAAGATPDAQRLLDAILANATVAVFVMDAQYECVYMNPAAERLSGYTLGEMRGRLLHDVVHHTHPDGSHFPIDACPIGISLETNDRAVGEEVFVHKDGSFYPVAFAASPMKAEDGSLLGTVLEVRDIRAERATLQALREADRTKDAFLAMVGHELRNPLAPIVTSLQLLQLRGVQAPELEVIGRQVGHLTRLVDDLLDIARVARGVLELRKERTDLAAVVARSVEMVRPQLQARRQDLQVDLPAGELAVHGDAARLAQVVGNLLVNASKFSPPASRIDLHVRRDSDHWRLVVRDRGEGIAPELLDTIFDPFQQAPQAQDRARGGLGLGLAIARNLVELHGGTIAAHSDGPGRGARFTVSLPAACEASPTPPHAVEPAAAPQPTAAQRPVRVLVVDDSRDAADALRDLLEAHGHTVLAVYDGVQALDHVRRFAPEVALLDLGLPGMDGLTLARRMRELCGERTPKLVALTGYGQASDRERSREAGFGGHLVKPVGVLELLRLLEPLVAASHG